MAAVLHNKIVRAIAIVIVLAGPGLLAGILWTPDATGPFVLGALIGVTGVMATGWRLTSFEVLVFTLAVPLSVVAGAVPLSGAAMMALLCLLAGISSLRGLHGAWSMVPLVLAYPMISPGPLGALQPDRTDTAYLLCLAALMGGGALWMTAVIPVLLRRSALPELQPASRQDALVYTAMITILCSGSTFAVLSIGATSQGAWLILTLLAVTQLGPMMSMRRSVNRVLGTVLGAVVAGGIAAVVATQGVQTAVALACLVTALALRTKAYWLYVTFLTPAVVLLSAPASGLDAVVGTGEARLEYTVIGVVQVMIATGLVLFAQSWHGSTKVSSDLLQPDPPIAPDPAPDPAG